MVTRHNPITPETPRSSPFRSWLEIFRIPNLPTVPGDVLAGAILAAGGFHDGSGTLFLAIWAALCLYLAGIILNDVVDVERDRVARPTRPIPSGRIHSRTAVFAGIKLGLLGLVLAAMAGSKPLIIAVLLLAMVLVYTYTAKGHRFFGPLTMGLCRGLNLLLGAAATGMVFTALPLSAALAMTGYVAAVTFLARQETTTKVLSRISRALPLSFGFLALVLMLPTVLRQSFSPLALTLLLAAWAGAFFYGWKGIHTLNLPQERSVTIGRLIRALIFIQAALCLTFGDASPALVVLCFWPLSAWLSRRFYAS